MTIQLSHPDLTHAVAGLRRTGDALDERRHHVEQQVACLLDGGWSGAAASAYREGWEEWRAGCREVLVALEVMSELVVAAAAGLDDVDAGVRDGCAVLAGRLGERLG